MNALLLLSLSALTSVGLARSGESASALPTPNTRVWSSAHFNPDDLPCDLPQSAAKFTLNDRRTSDNAYLMMAASHLAYRFWPGRREKILRQWGFTHFEFIDNSRTSTNGFWAEHHDFVLIVFRGTQEPTDWFTDVDVSLDQTPLDWKIQGRVHRGFLTASRSVEQDVKAAVAFAQSKRKPLLLAGHSLGGAVALLSAVALETMHVQVHSVWTFGSPKIGDSEFSNATQRLFNNRLLQLNQPEDPIPLLPFAQKERDTLNQWARRVGTYAPLIDTFAANAAYSSNLWNNSADSSKLLTEIPLPAIARGFMKHLPRSYVCDLSKHSLQLN